MMTDPSSKSRVIDEGEYVGGGQVNQGEYGLKSMQMWYIIARAINAVNVLIRCFFFWIVVQELRSLKKPMPNTAELL